jgi:aarF domain-containing kinase
MEFIEGDKIDDIETLTKKYGDPTKCTNILIDVWAKMVFNDGHIHCDAHPGNILVRPNPKDSKKP